MAEQPPGLKAKYTLDVLLHFKTERISHIPTGTLLETRAGAQILDMLPTFCALNHDNKSSDQFRNG